VRKLETGKGGVPYIVTHDGRTIRYPDPDVKIHDTIMLNLESGKITDFVKFDVGNMVMAIGGHNNGRVGVIVHREKHKGSFEIVHIEDAVSVWVRVFAGLDWIFFIWRAVKSPSPPPKPCLTPTHSLPTGRQQVRDAHHQRVCHWQGQGAAHLSAQGQGHQAHHSPGAGQVLR
jgi:hypothetical protein